MVDDDATFYAALGKRIRRLRAARGLTQHKLAQLLGISRSSLATIETGKQMVPVHLLLKLGQMLKVSFGDLLPTPSSTSLPPGDRPTREQWIHDVVSAAAYEEKRSDEESTVRAGQTKSRRTARVGGRDKTPSGP